MEAIDRCYICKVGRCGPNDVHGWTQRYEGFTWKQFCPTCTDKCSHTYDDCSICNSCENCCECS